MDEYYIHGFMNIAPVANLISVMYFLHIIQKGYTFFKHKNWALSFTYFIVVWQSGDHLVPASMYYMAVVIVQII